MFKQTIKGLNTHSVSVNGSDADLNKLAAIFAGKVEKYKLVGSGGTKMNALPDPINKKVFVVGSTNATGRLSTMMTIPHVKVASEYPDLVADIKGKFDCSYEDTTKCDYVTLKYDK
ncbi:hypothetical protein [Campylobacter curvus]|uniref:hypothetical protein n=1 Tax=Campylobacter curvus TaxID=200 RepID=UPI00146FD986|nr:hypothetical protein [Campylobacter curvus]